MPRIQINLIGSSTRPSSSWAVTSQWAVSTLPTPAQMQTVLNNLRSALAASAAFKASIASNYSLVSLRALGYSVPTAPADWTVDAGGAAVPGTAFALVVPLACVVSEQTGAAGPSYRGRSYWPGAGGGAANDGSISPASQQTTRTGWLAFHNAAVTALSTLGGTPVHVVFSKKTGEMTPITIIRTGNRVDTARGRFGDAPESYIAEAVPGTVTLDLDGPGEDDLDVRTILGLPPDATDEQVTDAALAIINQDSIDGSDILGGLKTLWSAAKTAIELRKGAS